MVLPEDAADLPADERVRARPDPATGAGKRRHREVAAPKSPARNAIEWLAVIIGAILVAVFVRSFLFQTFYIPSKSMTDTLQEDDRVIVNKLSYRFGDISRGDVVVFRRPSNDPLLVDKDLIKRVVGLPGDRVSITEGSVKINGEPLDEPYTGGLPTDASAPCGPGEVTGLNTERGLVIPEGQVLVLGDNRISSHDGRCFGPISEDLVVGRAFALIWPLSRTGGL